VHIHRCQNAVRQTGCSTQNFFSYKTFPIYVHPLPSMHQLKSLKCFHSLFHFGFSSSPPFPRLQVWIYEPEQLVRVILSRPPSEVQSERDEILIELTNVTKKHIIIDDIRYHVDGVGRIRMDWADLLFHAVDYETKNIVPVFDILNEIDAKYDFLKDYYSVSILKQVSKTLSLTEKILCSHRASPLRTLYPHIRPTSKRSLISLWLPSLHCSLCCLLER
jgi:hypothetical protein